MHKMIKFGSVLSSLVATLFTVNTISAETIDESSSGAVSIETFQIKDGKPVLTTSPTQKGYLYTLLEGEDIANMTRRDTTKGDGKAWSPTISVFGGMSGFYSILASREITPVAQERYCVIDLTNNDVTYLDSVPAGGWSDEYKTTKLVLRQIKAGTFMMGSPEDEFLRYGDETQHMVTLTQDYWIGVFEVTQKQWELVMGTRPSYFTNVTCYDSRPVETVSYDDIRGINDGAQWPESDNVDADSFMGILRSNVPSLKFDLPTEAQWEYACRAGTTTSLNNGKNISSEDECANVAEVARYWFNNRGEYIESSDTDFGTAKVGSYKPNDWGLYDMHGNVYEWCLDWTDETPYRSDDAIDPVGEVTGVKRILRGGGWNYNARGNRSAIRNWDEPSLIYEVVGFRIVAYDK